MSLKIYKNQYSNQLLMQYFYKVILINSNSKVNLILVLLVLIIHVNKKNI